MLEEFVGAEDIDDGEDETQGDIPDPLLHRGAPRSNTNAKRYSAMRSRKQ